MTFGQLFTIMNPDVKVRKNGTCMWLYLDDVNYYTIGAEWWDKEIQDNTITVLEEHEGRLSGMVDREKVIKTIEICYSEKHNCTECELFYVDDCNHKLMRDVLELLKEQEAKVLTVDQLEDALDTVVWLETPVSENLADGYSLIMAYSHKYGYMFFDSPFGDNPSQDRLEYSEYGKSWRCWDKRPTDEQRKAVKWDDGQVSQSRR